MQIAAAFDNAELRKYPSEVVVAIARDSLGKHNPITLGWSMFTSHNPPMLAISVGLQRHSLDAIRQSGEFVIAFVSPEMAGDTLYFGTYSGRDEDKLAVRGTKTQPATEIDSVILSDAVSNFECVLDGELQTHDHVIFAGRVVASHMNQDPGVQRLYNVGKKVLRGVQFEAPGPGEDNR